MGTIRWANPDDAAAMLAIYAPVVITEATSFEIEPPSVAEFTTRVVDGLAHHPWLVAVDDAHALMGYTYASTLRGRPAYQWSAETTIYVSPAHQRRGVGTALYGSLHDVLAARNIANLFAAIVTPNDASITLHERLGYERVGTFPRVGHKFGRWHDTGWWHKALTDAERLPPPRTMDDLLGDPTIAAGFDQRSTQLR